MSEVELNLSVGDYVVVRKVHNLLNLTITLAVFGPPSPKTTTFSLSGWEGCFLWITLYFQPIILPTILYEGIKGERGFDKKLLHGLEVLRGGKGNVRVKYLSLYFF